MVKEVRVFIIRLPSNTELKVEINMGDLACLLEVCILKGKHYMYTKEIHFETGKKMLQNDPCDWVSVHRHIRPYQYS